MRCHRSNSSWKTLLVTILFIIESVVCNVICHDADNCGGGDESVACACLCHGPIAPLPEQPVAIRHFEGSFVACETLLIPALLPADIFRPPLC